MTEPTGFKHPTTSAPEIKLSQKKKKNVLREILDSLLEGGGRSRGRLVQAIFKKGFLKKM